VAAYLAIERLRLGPRLETRIDVDDAVLSVPVPALSIQPLVENSIKHGLSAKPEGGRLTVAAKALNGQLRISVEDTGLGMSGRPGSASGEGVGIMNVTRRLQLCYGPQCELTVRSGESGTHVEFAVPLA
jgi:two-component system LytT family sensor kinase